MATSLPCIQLPQPPLSSPKATSRETLANEKYPIRSHPTLLLLEKCSSMAQLQQIHAHVLRSGLFFDSFTAEKIVAFCALKPSGRLSYARLVFPQIVNPTSFAVNSIIRGYTNNNFPREAVLFYREIIEGGLIPDRFTFPSLFKSCKDSDEGKQLHCHVLKFGFASDTYVQNTLINMYANHGCLIQAGIVFDKMTERTVVSFASMIAAYAKWDLPREAFALLDQMKFENVLPNEAVLINVLVACKKARDLCMAKWVHEYINENQIDFSTILTAALMDAYCKCGCITLARELFDNFPDKNLFCWNIMISGHVEDNDYKEALALFHEMQRRGFKPDEVTMASLLLACSHLGALELGKWLHAYIVKENIEVDVVLGTGLVDMYARCGSIESASWVFYGMPQRDVMTWTAMIRGLAMSGNGEKALQLFYDMQRSGLKPDAITFIGVLTACSHAGLVEEGFSHFDSMSSLYSIQPTIEHYGCMVDLLGRAGYVERAEEFMRNMPMAPDNFVLGGLLGACRIHGNLEVAERAAKELLKFNPDNGGAYVLLSNIYGSLGKWDEVKRTRELMAERKVEKPPGCSLIEVDGTVHEFGMGDKSHLNPMKNN